ncbi:putative mitochondrial protein [Cucumis melo var. makuwa]|uniref:Mitochondrial protein n=1 Tax=Cucumis melo var. makuwa TaxID=1194695 RepID=A0A5A7SMI3_CUCMM|nr:putative mitochondrial protein [Cucumis melo var. makuwa]KAA0056227.1 putative mitochondrial protein [Cucumis melo var. makuwa]
MFQFAKFEKFKERRLATELGYGFPIVDPWITDEISPWPFASESVLLLNLWASIQCILFYTVG